VYGFAGAAKAMGASILEGVEATAILIEGEKVVGVETPLGAIATETVVAVPGAYTNKLLNPLGLEYGLLTNRVQIAILRRTADDFSHPVYIDGPNGTWHRPEGEFGTLTGVFRDQLGVDPDYYDEGVDFDYIKDARDRCARRRPALANAFMRGGWAGIITMSPDSHAILDQLAPYAGLYGILGDSGTNFKTAPAIGKSMAEWIVDGAPQSVDLHPFRATRFAEGSLFAGEHEYGEGLLDVSR
jgi:sarcosine oxidase subunit beta